MLRITRRLCLCLSVGLSACSNDNLCTAEDHPSLILSARSAADNGALSGLSGTVVSGGEVLPVGCGVEQGGDVCRVFARGSTADIHLELDGYLPWDTTGVQLHWRGDAGCRTPVLKSIEARMIPLP